MIGWLSGTVRNRDPRNGRVMLETAGVGYQIAVSLQTFAEVPGVGDACALWIHTHVREDVLALFGFASQTERRMFELLVSVPQVGPKNAIGVLGGFPLAELMRAIAEGERAKLERIPGVGKKTAERILLDLRDKVLPLLDGHREPGGVAPASGREGVRDEARHVLTNLGWRGKQVDAALDDVLGEGAADEALDGVVRMTLARLMKR